MQITSPVVIGRGAELALLDRGLAAARDRRGGTLFLIGEAGIGKSRLAAECAARAGAAGMPVLRGRSGTSGLAMPFRPVTEALLSYFRLLGPPRDPELAPYRPVLARLVPDWRDGTVADGPVTLIEVAEAVLRLLAVAGRDTGCLLVIEDLHDADAETLAVLDYLVDNVAGLPVLILATLRPDPVRAADLARDAARRRSAVLSELSGFTPEQVRQMAAACLGVDRGALPGTVGDHLVQHGDGSPFVVEEILRGMVAANVLRTGPAGWRVFGDLDIEVPVTVVRSVARRAHRLGAQGGELLQVAAVLGRRFDLAELRTVTGLDDRSLIAHLRAAIDGHLVTPSGSVADSYEFRHALIADALLASLTPTERAAIARRAADAVERAHPGLPGDWGQRVATLRLASGDLAGAGLLFARAGDAALAAGGLTSAVGLLERARELLTGRPELTDVLESLPHALAEAGQLDRALALIDQLPVTGGLSHARAAALHTRMAWWAASAGRVADGVAQVALARTLLGRAGGAEQTAALDVVEGELTLNGHMGATGPDRLVRAEELATRAVGAAEAAGQHVVACQSWQLLSKVARLRGTGEADACLERVLDIAETHGLPVWHIHALTLLGGNEFLRTGHSHQLERALKAARGIGEISLLHTVEVSLARIWALRGDHADAREVAERCLASSTRLRHVDNQRMALLTLAVVAAHQGQRREMDRALAEFGRRGGTGSMHVPVVFGHCRAFCALLEEDRDRAVAELGESLAWSRTNLNIFPLDGRFGLRPFLRVLAGHAPAEEDPAGQLRWNRQFVLFAQAVSLGRAGRAAEATAAMTAAREAARPFPVAHHLGLRLVAEDAVAHGWGDPEGWLRAAEQYFHPTAPAVAAACRGLLRRAGANVGQRRSGTGKVPAVLRDGGVTVREYEVFRLLGSAPANREIAERLFISPRTAEKHVASLIAKTGQPNRAALCDYAAHLQPPPAG
ncbi:hypothetical protein Lfu02_60070 [Longispora fulva]|uniref:DNA-binding CsgD family transcriptional regulator/tetratricopeptide (TPR) repeat protein n=1 Tax=Longispora fulva TaxID=619741 RepID=A0A8J7GTL9_9ACTN|nr:LuxR family transcriptional regulator [Longispora fulva]MBG6137011.1 DNA-binding CsgD family transcriptional regulator/tetratricopeptide (TPR) repeat protein [Longispora fulva]GIG61635.1 hypothetical protein Lfu02_60070 [Longispora fulva]